MALWLLAASTGCRESPSAGPAQERSPGLDSKPDVLELARRFELDPAFRRQALEDSLVNKKNGYARVRLERYNDGDWGSLAVAAFPSRPVVPQDLGRAPPLPDDSWTPVKSDSRPASPEALRKLGERMFTRYPAQIERAMVPILKQKGGPQRYGLWQTETSVGGLVWTALPGGVYPALTCSTCHASVDVKGSLRPGLPNHLFDIGKAKEDYLGTVSLYSGWGPGRVDVAADGRDNPVVIADLRPVSLQTFLHRTANIKSSLLALAVRVETGLITAHHKAVRPGRIEAFALAFYLWGLSGELRPLPSPSHPGRKVFDQHCSSCHQGESLAGPPVAAESMSSPVADMPSSVRGTGTLQTTSLRGVSDRQRLLYGGQATSLSELLNPERRTGGHYVGRGLDAAERESLRAYLELL